jgi:hypothetical protein
MGAGMVRADRYLFFSGGRANGDWSLMYACDLDRMPWFDFGVLPDGEAVSFADGSVSGLLMLPRIHSFGMCYVAATRQIVAFLGTRRRTRPLFVVDLSEALGVIHPREDMVVALRA